MAFANQKKVELTVGGYGTDTGYTSRWGYATLIASFSNGTITWKITTNVETGYSIPYIYLYLNIDGQDIIDKYYQSSGNSDGPNEFPRKDGSSKSGTVTLKDANDTSVPVRFKIGISRNRPNGDPGSAYDKSATLTRTYYTNGTSPSNLKITDKGNNKFIISGTHGTPGTNNPLEKTVVYYTIATGDNTPADPANSSTVRTRLVFDDVSKKDFSSNEISVTARTNIKIWAYSEFTYGSDPDVFKQTTEPIKYYAAPTMPSTPIINYTKSRLTIRENWKYIWTTGAGASNTDSPVKGYRIYIYKNNSAITGLATSATNNLITKGTGTNTYIDRETTLQEIVFNPETMGFAPGDEVHVGIQPYTRYGDTNKTILLRGSVTKSATSEVQNAGIMQVKTADGWKEGQVYVKTDNGWQEAEAVHVKTEAGWKESQ